MTWGQVWTLMQFQSTLPVRGATRPLDGCLCGLQFQSTLPVRGATYTLLVT